MVCIRIKDHELLIWDGFVTTSLIFCTQSAFKIKTALFKIHLEILLYFEIIPLQGEKFLRVFMHFMWYVLMPSSYPGLAISLTERPQTNLEKAKHENAEASCV